jgi:gliding motility-associated-like protein
VFPTGTDIFYFIDDDAETYGTSYFYRVSVIDSCFNESVIANTSRTILLNVASGEDLVNDLSWNAYESWDAGVAGYRVYRRIGEGSAAQQVGQTGPGELVYSDDVSSLAGGSGRISYFVEAYEGPGNQFGFEDAARSNEVLADVMERVFVPNAIAPNGTNNRLKPVGTFIGEENYLFSLYNRWGQLVFETYNPSDAWDGRYNGKFVESGVYVYLLRFTSATGENILRKGTVAVIF